VEGQLDDSFQVNRMLKEELKQLKSARDSPVSVSQGKMRAFGDQGDALKKQRDKYEVLLAEMKNRFQKDINDMERQLRETEAQKEKLVMESGTVQGREQIEQLAKERERFADQQLAESRLATSRQRELEDSIRKLEY